MLELIYDKRYPYILFGIKTLIVAIVFSVWFFAMTKSAWTPMTVEKLSTMVIQKEYDLKLDNLTWSVREQTNNIFPQNSKEIENAVIAIMDQKQDFHWAWDNINPNKYKKMTDRICNNFKKECSILNLEWNFTSQERYVYTLISVYFMHKIDQNLRNEWRSLFDWFKKLTLRAQLSKDKSQWACYTSRRWCADHHTLLLNLELINWPQEYANVLVHELSHIVDLWVVVWKSKTLDQNFTEFGKPAFSIDDPSIVFYATSWKSEKIRKKWARKEDFISLYWMTNPFEDMAEAWIAYKMHNAYFKVLALTNRYLYKKYQRRANIYWGKYIFSDWRNAIKAKNNPDKRVWDMTKLMLY